MMNKMRDQIQMTKVHKSYFDNKDFAFVLSKFYSQSNKWKCELSSNVRSALTALHFHFVNLKKNISK